MKEHFMKDKDVPLRWILCKYDSKMSNAFTDVRPMYWGTVTAW